MTGRATKLGNVVSGDFLAIDEAVQIVESVKKGQPPLDIVLKLARFYRSVPQ